MTRRSPLLVVLAAVLAAGSLSACATGAGGSLPNVNTTPLEPSRQLTEQDGGPPNTESSTTAEGGGTAGASDASLPAQASAARDVIRTGDLSLEVSRPSESADAVAAVAEELGGSVAMREVSQPYGGSATTATVVIRVPSERFDEAFERLTKLGNVLSDTRNASDVTEQRADLDARVKALESSVERLRELMRGSASTAELIEAEQALSDRQQELDGLRAQLESLEGQVAEASIAVSLRSPSALPGGGPATFWDGLLQGLSSLGATGSALLVALGIALPWLAILGVIALAVILIVRASVRRGRRARAAQAVPGGERLDPATVPPSHEHHSPEPLSGSSPAPGESQDGPDPLPTRPGNGGEQPSGRPS